jgi:hypothetical protein
MADLSHLGRITALHVGQHGRAAGLWKLGAQTVEPLKVFSPSG